MAPFGDLNFFGKGTIVLRASTSRLNHNIVTKRPTSTILRLRPDIYNNTDVEYDSKNLEPEYYVKGYKCRRRIQISKK